MPVGRKKKSKSQQTTFKKGDLVSDVDLANYVRDLPGPPRFFHLSIKAIQKKDLKSIDQPLILGFNCSGRPSGFYFGVADSWMRFLINFRQSANWEFCCYLYEVEIDESKFLKLDSLKKVKEFDKKTPDYWLGFENYDLCNQLGNVLNPARNISFHRLFQKYKKGNKSLGDIYVEEKIIYSSSKALKNERKSLGLQALSAKTIDQERNKRWDKVAEKYDGVLLHPYYESYRKFWYESFSVPQGIIWNLTSLKKLTPVAHVVSRKNRDFTFILDRNF